MLDGSQPAFGAGEEAERRHHHQRDSKIEAGEPGADQPHVVIERKPTDEDIVWTEIGRMSDGTDIGQQVGVGEHHAFRVARAPRSVLNEGGVERADGDRPWHASAGDQLGYGGDAA